METWRAARVPNLPGRGPEPHLADTATGELALAAIGPEATLYACGITPYDATHIGHAATYVAWDLLVRAWRDAGHEVTYVQNVTDVDDPLLERADRDGEDWRARAGRGRRTRWTAWSGSWPGQGSRPGIPVSGRGGRAGMWSARLSRRTTSGRCSTSRRA